MNDHRIAVQTDVGTFRVAGHIAAMILALVGHADEINTARSGEVTLRYGGQKGIRLFTQHELGRVPVQVKSNAVGQR